ncbi:MAG: glycosyl hydrolase [Cyanobacteria bacterium P01_F01_bin.86]
MLILFAGKGDATFSAEGLAAPSLLVGLYTPGYVGESSVLRQEVQAVDSFSQQHSLVGLFIDLEAPNPGYDIPTALHQLHDNGYTGFVNFTSQRSAAAIASGQIDLAIKRMAQAYREWAEDVEHPLTFIAPLPEMNGAWETYGQTPQQFKQAYHHIQAIFADEGVPEDSILWVFAPNGWSENGHEFEQYYPGDRMTDIVAFSAYNWGYCHNASWQQWQSPETVFGPYIARMKQMAPNHPIFIAQTATTSMTQLGTSSEAKDEWLNQAYRYLENSGVRGVLYFNIDKECDWAVYSQGRSPSNGYQQAVTEPSIQYQSPASVQALF